jgi:hypothetical protein
VCDEDFISMLFYYYFIIIILLLLFYYYFYGNINRLTYTHSHVCVAVLCRFLVPLMLIHGRYNYIRCSKLVLYSFFKNLCLVSILFYYCFYSGFSGTVPLDSLVFAGYNFYLGLPIIALGKFVYICVCIYVCMYV